jgi:hypothetical protein
MTPISRSRWRGDNLDAGFDPARVVRCRGPHGAVVRGRATVGGTTAAALATYQRTGDPAASGSADDRAQANGSLMRTMPVAVARRRDASLRASEARARRRRRVPRTRAAVSVRAGAPAAAMPRCADRVRRRRCPTRRPYLRAVDSRPADAPPSVWRCPAALEPPPRGHAVLRPDTGLFTLDHGQGWITFSCRTDGPG